MSGATLASEDQLSEQVGLVLASEVGLVIDQCLRRGGSGYLRSRVQNFCDMAMHSPVVVIADLDRQVCPSRFIRNWLGAREKPDNLLIRIAVREIEAWLLADHVGMRQLLGTRAGTIPRSPDTLDDPKRELLKLANRASRRIRDALLPVRGALTSQGLGYNSTLSGFVKNSWSPLRAAERSPSLSRTRDRIAELSKRVNANNDDL